MNHTFVICVYGDSKYLEECIESLIKQNSVINGLSSVILYTSTPSTYISELTDKYGIEVFTKQGGGIGIDWNNALGFVKTQYATIAHQDDTYLPNYGLNILAAFNKSADTLIAFSDYAEINQNGERRQRGFNLKIKSVALQVLNLFPRWKLYQRRIYALGNFISAPAVSYNMKALNDFEFNENMRMALDWDAWERIMKMQGVIRFTGQIDMLHRIHGGSVTTKNTTDKNRELEELQMYKRYWPAGIAKLIMHFYVSNQNYNS